MPAQFSVLFVGVGNVCRSPLAEALLRVRLDETLGDLSDLVTVGSAGVSVVVGSAMDEMVAQEVVRLGHRQTSGSPRPLTASMVEHGDLVLTASRALRSRVLRGSPAALRRTFTIKEFAALVSGQGAESPQALVRDAARRRSGARLDDYDIPDPLGKGSKAHRRAADVLVETVAGVIAPTLADAVRAEVIPRVGRSGADRSGGGSR